eukprot:gene2691-3338_t
MINWGHENDIEWNSKLKVYEFKNDDNSVERGVISTSVIEAGEVLVSVPSDLLIHSYTKPTVNLPIQFQQSVYNHFNSKQRIAFILIYEKLLKHHSKWFRYLDDIPNKYTTTATYTQNQINSLRYPLYVEDATKLRNELLDSYNRYCSLINEYSGNQNEKSLIVTIDNNKEKDELYSIKITDLIDFNSYSWSWGVIQTRTYYYSGNLNKKNSNNSMNDKDDCTLVPLADLFNHSSKVDTEAVFNEKLKRYQVITKSRFESNEQVFISYGKHNNFKLLNYYGFLIRGNDQESITIQIDDAIPESILKESLSSSKTDHDRKLKILGSYGLGDIKGGKYEIVKDDHCPFSWNYLAILRVLLMNEQELNQSLERNIFFDDCPVSSENESKLSNFLVQLCENQLNSYFNGITQETTSNRDQISNDINYLLSSGSEMWRVALSWSKNLILSHNQPPDHKKSHTSETNTVRKKLTKNKKVKV